MCKKCAEALQEIFPEVPKEEWNNFLMGCTCYPFGDHDQVRAHLLDLRTKMKTDDYHECYAIADEEMTEAERNMRRPFEVELELSRDEYKALIECLNGLVDQEVNGVKMQPIIAQMLEQNTFRPK
jgi:hypothetical protein